MITACEARDIVKRRELKNKLEEEYSDKLLQVEKYIIDEAEKGGHNVLLTVCGNIDDGSEDLKVFLDIIRDKGYSVRTDYMTFMNSTSITVGWKEAK